ncbi:hypothetical protein BLOT_007431 [Blomia tropicalis]|nr:hypothetical protein BLOT_007431 [Blomia tropicalis]
MANHYQPILNSQRIEYHIPSSNDAIQYDHYQRSHNYHRHPNDTCQSYAPGEMLLQPYRFIFSTLIAITALITLLLNLFVIGTLVLNDNCERNKTKNSGNRSLILRTKYTNTHLSFISLSISVIIYSSICVPGMYLQTIDNHNRRNFMIRILKFCFYVSPIASSFVHLLMAFDRKHYSSRVQLIITLIRLLLSFTIPSVLTLAIYLSLAYKLAKIQREEMAELKVSLLKNKQSIVKHRRVIVKIIILGLTHFICWVPFSLVESLNDLFPDLFHRCSSDIHMPIYYRLMSVLILLTSMSGIAYPILYCFVSIEFRRRLERHLLSFCGRNKHGTESSGSGKSSNTRSISDENDNTFKLAPNHSMIIQYNGTESKL